MSFILALIFIYALQIWVCTSRPLNLCKVEQLDTCRCGILRDQFVSYVLSYVYYVTYDLYIYLFNFIQVYVFTCAHPKLEVIDASWGQVNDIFMYYSLKDIMYKFTVKIT